MSINEDERVQIIEYLMSLASIDKFYLRKLQSSDSYIAYYYDMDCNFWVLMEDDDVFFKKCIEFLIREGVIVFESIEEVKEYEKQIKYTSKEE